MFPEAERSTVKADSTKAPTSFLGLWLTGAGPALFLDLPKSAKLLNKLGQTKRLCQPPNLDGHGFRHLSLRVGDGLFPRLLRQLQSLASFLWPPKVGYSPLPKCDDPPSSSKLKCKTSPSLARPVLTMKYKLFDFPTIQGGPRHQL